METDFGSMDKKLLATLTVLVKKHDLEKTLMHIAWVCIQTANKLQDKKKLPPPQIREMKQWKVAACTIRHCAELVEYAQLTI